jgi:hypothetical protein
MRHAFLAGFAVAAVGLIAPAGAQQLQSCQNWEAVAQSGTAEAMQALSGVWRTQNVLPAVPGVSPPTPEEITMTRYLNGQLQYRKYACFAPPPPPPGLPPLQGRCAEAIGHGGWFAFRQSGDWFFVGLMMIGSSYNGALTPANCSSVRVRFLDADHIENEYGGIGERVSTVR